MLLVTVSLLLKRGKWKLIIESGFIVSALLLFSLSLGRGKDGFLISRGYFCFGISVSFIMVFVGFLFGFVFDKKGEFFYFYGVAVYYPDNKFLPAGLVAYLFFKEARRIKVLL